MPRTPIVSLLTLAIALSGTAAALASNSSSPAKGPSPFVLAGEKGSDVDAGVFHAQVLLDAAGFPAGVIDGKTGQSFTKALQGFQEARGLATSGKLDAATRTALLALNRAPTAFVTLSAAQVAGPFTYPLPKKAEDQAKVERMGYRNMLEKLAEEFHTTPDTIVKLNGPQALIGPGQTLRLPNVAPTSADYGGLKDDDAALMRDLNVASGDIKGDHVVVDKSEGVLKVMDKGDRLVAQFPVTMGSSHDPLPLGDWKVTTYAYLPPFHYQPNLFWDVDDQKGEQTIPPGPNGPVGVAWLDLTKEHYGIHGTPAPETIGRAESHGCIRLSNWDVLRLSRMMAPGFKATFQA